MPPNSISALVCREERHHRSDRRKLRRSKVCLVAVGGDRGRVRIAAEIKQAPQRQCYDVFRFIGRVRTGLTKGRDACHDQFGFDATRDAKLSPLLSMRPGFSLSTMRSASFANCRTMCWPSGRSRSIAAPRLPALKYANWRLNSTCAQSSRKGPSRRTGDPPTGSMRMTSAPRSANCLPQYCPADPERSRTRIPVSAAGAPLTVWPEALQASAVSAILAVVAASDIELVPGAAIAPARDPSQRIDGLMTYTVARHHAFGAVDGDDFADNQMRARSFVSKLRCPVQAALKMDGDSAMRPGRTSVDGSV